MDEIDHRIIALLTEDSRRTYDDIGQRVLLSAPAVKRRVDRLRGSGAIRGFTVTIDHSALGASTEAFVELFYRAGTLRSEVAASLARHPEIVEAWMVTGEADAMARVRTRGTSALEDLIMALQADGLVERTRSQIALSQLV